MPLHHISRFAAIIFFASLAIPMPGQNPSSPSSAQHGNKSADSTLDPGTITNGVYRNKTLGFSYKIPEAWVLRTDELNARQDEAGKAQAEKNEAEKAQAQQVQAEKEKPDSGKPDSIKSDSGKPEEKQTADQPKNSPPPASSAGAKVLLAAFSRPPEAKGEEINSSILIAAENASAYPGLKDAAQYFYPLTEVANAQGFIADEDPYEIAVGTKTLVRGDFHKDHGTRVMRQSTLALLAHGYAISITVIAGTEDEVEELIDALSFTSPGK